MKVKGKVVIITGAGNGIGREAAILFANTFPATENEPPGGATGTGMWRHVAVAVDRPHPAGANRAPGPERSAAWLAHQSGGLGVGSSNLPAPTNKIKDL